MAAFAAADTLVERFGSLATPARRPNVFWWLVVLLPGVLLGIVATYGLARWGQGAYCLVSMPGWCKLK
jgi:hypothetical protein